MILQASQCGRRRDGPRFVAPRATADVVAGTPAQSCEYALAPTWARRGQRKTAGARRCTVPPWRPASCGRMLRRPAVSGCLARRYPGAAEYVYGSGRLSVPAAGGMTTGVPSSRMPCTPG
jgi:hypothetical protein